MKVGAREAVAVGSGDGCQVAAVLGGLSEDIWGTAPVGQGSLWIQGAQQKNVSRVSGVSGGNVECWVVGQPFIFV